MTRELLIATLARLTGQKPETLQAMTDAEIEQNINHCMEE